MALMQDNDDATTLSAARFAAKLALAEAIARDASSAIANNTCACVRQLAEAFDAFPPPFGRVFTPSAPEGNVMVHSHAMTTGGGGMSGGGGGMSGGGGGYGETTEDVLAESHATAPGIEPLPPELSQRLDDIVEHGEHMHGQPSPTPTPGGGGTLTPEQAQQLRHAVSQAKTALAQAVASAAPQGTDDKTCACIINLASAFAILPPPDAIVAGTPMNGGGGHSHGGGMGDGGMGNGGMGNGGMGDGGIGGGGMHTHGF